MTFWVIRKHTTHSRVDLKYGMSKNRNDEPLEAALPMLMTPNVLSKCRPGIERVGERVGFAGFDDIEEMRCSLGRSKERGYMVC